VPLKGRWPARVEVDPFDPVRAIDVADCWEGVRCRGPEVSTLSCLLLDQVWEGLEGGPKGVLQRRDDEPWSILWGVLYGGHCFDDAAAAACGWETGGVESCL